jgi:hypothetical protein
MVNTENRKQILSPTAIIDYIKKERERGGEGGDKSVFVVNPDTTLMTG